MPRSISVLVAVLAVVGASCVDDEPIEPVESTTTSPARPFFEDVPAPTAPPARSMTVVEVYFWDSTSELDALVPVTRTVPADEPATGALRALFAGPTQAERDRGLRLVRSGTTGSLPVTTSPEGVATVQLTGGCDRGGDAVTVADLVIATLRAQPEILAVKLLDPDGRTSDPSGPGSSRPECLALPSVTTTG